MAEPFDPYVDWLGLAPSSRPRNRYQILGLDNFEEDPQRIASQADAMLNRLRSVRPGPKRNVWQELLDELTLAKICLSDSSRKLHYDGQLRAEGVTASPIARPGPDEPPLPPRLNPDLFPPGMAAPPPAASSGWPPSATQPPAAETSWPKTAVEPAWPPAQSAPGFATAAIPPVLDPMFPPNPLLPPQPAAADPQLPPAASNPAARRPCSFLESLELSGQHPLPLPSALRALLARHRPVCLLPLHLPWPRGRVTCSTSWQRSRRDQSPSRARRNGQARHR